MVQETDFTRLHLEAYPSAKPIELGPQIEHYIRVEIYLRCSLRERRPVPKWFKKF
jgi:hypothetical protein